MEQQDLQGRRVLTAFQDHWAQQVQLVLKEVWEALGLQAYQDLSDHLGRLEMVDLLVDLVHLVQRDLLDHLEHLDHLAELDLPAPLDHTDQMDNQVKPVLQVRLDLLVFQDPRVYLEHQEA